MPAKYLKGKKDWGTILNNPQLKINISRKTGQVFGLKDKNENKNVKKIF